MKVPLYQVREYGSKVGDYQLVAEWRKAHGAEFPETLLPPSGVIVERDGEPVAAAWMYMAVGIGVAFLDFISTAPGMTPGQSSEAIGHALAVLKRIAKDNNYGVLIGYTFPAIARCAEAHGFSTVADRVVQVVSTTD
jgi:hypothetical protein